MSSPAVHLRPKVEQAGDVRVITFTVSGVRDVENVIARELEGRTDGLGGCHLWTSPRKVDSGLTVIGIVRTPPG